MLKMEEEDLTGSDAWVELLNRLNNALSERFMGIDLL